MNRKQESKGKKEDVNCGIFVYGYLGIEERPPFADFVDFLPLRLWYFVRPSLPISAPIEPRKTSLAFSFTLGHMRYTWVYSMKIWCCIAGS